MSSPPPFPPATSRRRSLCGECVLANVCAKTTATVPSLATIRKRESRLIYQNHLVGLQTSCERLIDHLIDSLCSFDGRFIDEAGATIGAPGFAPLLTPGASFWLRDCVSGGAWKDIADVPRYRSETTGRWRIVAVSIGITTVVHRLCPRR